jgi:PAS domain-containing protein
MTSPSKLPSRTWTQTYSGYKFSPLAPRAADVCIEDIAHALSMICRYGGHAHRFYSVAEHSVLVSRLVAPEYAREGLMHDGAEAYIGDMIRPLKRQMPSYMEAETHVEAAIAEKFGLRTDEVARVAVKEFDDRILVDETRALMAVPDLYKEDDDGWFASLEPTGAEILGYTPERAEILFLLRFWELFPEHAPPDFKLSATFQIL